MTGPIRRAGRGTDASGAQIVWTVSEGRRGRRWREVRAGPAGVISSLLLETGPTGRFSHAEISTAAGLLTLHPEADGTLHGNVVGERGIDHVEALRWPADGVVLLEGSTIARAAAIAMVVALRAGRRTSRDAPSGATVTLAALHIDLRLGRHLADVPVARHGDGRWLFGGTDGIRVDEHGLPVQDDGASWPLEQGAGPGAIVSGNGG